MEEYEDTASEERAEDQQTHEEMLWDIVVPAFEALADEE